MLDLTSLRRRLPIEVRCVMWASGEFLAKIWQLSYRGAVSTMNISLPESLKSFVDERVADGGYGTSSEYVRELIRRDQGRLQLRALLLQGGASASAGPADQAYFDSLRARARRHPRP